jgi:N-acetylneuraminate synthase
MKYNTSFSISDRKISKDSPTYFIADIAANHDGDLERAKELIYQAAEAGAEAAKFQHFTAKTIVSDEGFKALGNQQSHQASWKKSVFEVYQDASINRDWTPILKETCDKAGIHFFTSPYSYELVDEVDPFVPAYKIGSGDITWDGIIERIAKKNKPVILACGASNILEVHHAVNVALKNNADFALLQCNTNYTASVENFKHINLNVLKSFQLYYPEMIIGLSDHTPGHSTVLGSVALGARIVEKHFTLSNDLEGPDHKFSMTPKTWRDMVDRTRELEAALGDGFKKIENNEIETAVLQRRSIRASRDIHEGEVLDLENVEFLRPCPEDGLPPSEFSNIKGKKILGSVSKGEHIRWNNLN